MNAVDCTLLYIFLYEQGVLHFRIYTGNDN